MAIIIIKKFDENLKKRFFNTNNLSNHDINKFILLLQKGVYLYEYMDKWEKFRQNSLPEKDDFYSHLNIEYITNADYVTAKGICKDLKINNLGDYHYLYVQSDTQF